MSRCCGIWGRHWENVDTSDKRSITNILSEREEGDENLRPFIEEDRCRRLSWWRTERSARHNANEKHLIPFIFGEHFLPKYCEQKPGCNHEWEMNCVQGMLYDYILEWCRKHGPMTPEALVEHPIVVGRNVDWEKRMKRDIRAREAWSYARKGEKE